MPPPLTRILVSSRLWGFLGHSFAVPSPGSVLLPMPIYSLLDISKGLEPVPIPLFDQNKSLLIEQLGQSFTYISDSRRPSGTAITDTAPAQQYDSSDEDNSDIDETWTCECEAGQVTCSAENSELCDCVGNFGNFYSSADAGDQGLLMNALPERLPLVECSPHCLCGVACSNRLTQGGIRVPVSVKGTPAGLGAFYSPGTDAILPRGSFICLYAGEYLTTGEARSRWSNLHDDNYILSLRLRDQVIHIDPRYQGNFGRFLNHSCEPNCMIQVVSWGAGPTWPRAAIFTLKEVLPEEELSFDYGNASRSADVDSNVADAGDGQRLTKCLCGAASCRGWMPFDKTL